MEAKADCNGIVEISSFFDSSGIKLRLDDIKLGKRFFTPAIYLEKARMTTSLHSPKGIINLD